MEDRVHRPQTASAFSPARQVDSVHDPRKSNVGKYHGDVASANQHGRQGCFGGFTFIVNRGPGPAARSYWGSRGTRDRDHADRIKIGACPLKSGIPQTNGTSPLI
jgi:hypothetical protein